MFICLSLDSNPLLTSENNARYADHCAAILPSQVSTEAFKQCDQMVRTKNRLNPQKIAHQ